MAVEARTQTIQRYVVRAIAAAALLCVAWALVIEPRRLVVRHVDLALPAWPSSHDGLRVALIADIHVDEAALETRVLAMTVTSQDGFLTSRVQQRSCRPDR